MSALSQVNLYINVFSKQLVSVNGSPTSVPTQFYGDLPTFIIYPVVPNPSIPGAFLTTSLAGFTMNITMAGQPNAGTPPTPFAQATGLVWNPPGTPTGSTITGSLTTNPSYGYFSSNIDITQIAVKNYLVANGNSGATAYVDFDVFDPSASRTTLVQTTFQLNPSIDTVIPAPGGGAIVYPTLQQLIGIFVQIGAVKGKYIVFQSPDGTQTKTMQLQNDGNFTNQ